MGEWGYIGPIYARLIQFTALRSEMGTSKGLPHTLG